MSASVFPVRASSVNYLTAFSAGHRGVDIFADRGSELVAVADGRAEKVEGERTGLGVRVVEPSGARYLYAHLDAYEGSYPRAVSAGDVLGYLGTTGNAAGKAPHVHFEYKPNGVDTVDPVPLLDALKWPGVSSPLQTVPAPPRASSSKRGFPVLLVVVLAYFYFESQRKSGSRRRVSA